MSSSAIKLAKSIFARSAQNMFFLKDLTHTISLHPQYFGPKIHEFLEQRLHQEVQGTCSGRYGYIICVVLVKDIGHGVLQSNTGMAEYEMKYQVCSFDQEHALTQFAGNCVQAL